MALINEAIDASSSDALLETEEYTGEAQPFLADEIQRTVSPLPLTTMNTRELHDLAYLQEVADLPQGRHMGIFAVIVNFVSRILGSGIFAVPALMYRDVGGSPALFFLVWFISGLLAFAGLYVYLEMGSLMARNGGTKTFLEFVYFRPKHLTTVVVGIYSVLFAFVISSSLVFGRYFLYSIGVEVPAESNMPGLTGFVLVSVSLMIHSISVRSGTFIQNMLGALKLFLLVAVALTGVYALLPTSLTSIEKHLFDADFFKPKEQVTIAGFTSALFKGFFAMSGWNSVHTLAGEIADPVRTLKISGPLALAIVSVCYAFINLAYLVVIPSDELMESGELVGGALFEKIFGSNIGFRILSASVALCAGGNVFVVMYSCARMIQEVFREGFLPFSKTFSSNRPFNTPLYPMLICCATSSAFLLMPARGNLYNYIVNLESYPGQLCIMMIAIGIFIVRRRYPEIRAPIRASTPLTVLLIAFSAFVLIGPLIPSAGSTMQFDGYPNYGITTCVFILLCSAYWCVKFRLLPRCFGYDLVPVVVTLDDGLTIKQWEKK